MKFLFGACLLAFQLKSWLHYVNCRIESLGKGILKPHQLLAEFEAISKDDKHKLHDGAFAEVLKSTQVKPGD